MRKSVLLFAMVFATVLSVSFSAFAGVVPAEYWAQSRVVMPNGAPVHEHFIKMKDGKMYVHINSFSGFSDVIAYNDFGGVDGKKTSVAELHQARNGEHVLIVVNKATGEVFVQTAAGDAPGLDAIIEDGNVYLPLRATAAILGGKVDYDAGRDLAIVTQN